MHKILVSVFYFSLSFLVFPKIVFAQVVINEISIIPEDKYDWVELYSPDVIDISGWKLLDEAGVFETIPPGTILGENIYYVATQYQRLDNDHDTVYLQDASGSQKDFIKYGYDGEVCVSLPTGSIARVPNANNHYYKVVSHSKGATNNSLTPDACPTPTPSPTNTPTPTPTSPPTPSPSPTPKPTNTQVPTKTPTPRPTVDQEIVAEKNEEIEKQREVLGSQEVAESTGANGTDQNKKTPLLAVALIGVGALFIGIPFIPYVKKLIKR